MTERKGLSKDSLKKGLALILLAAICNAVGQLLLKFGTNTTGAGALVLYAAGFILATVGAIFMMTAFRFGEVSILQPIMSIAYVFSFVLGLLFLGEPATMVKIFGTLLIMAGSIVMGLPSRQKVKQ